MQTQARKGYLKLQIGGQDRPLKFGTNQTAIYCDLHNLSLADYEDRFSFKSMLGIDEEGKVGKPQVQLSYLRDLLYSALVAGCHTDGLPVDFTTFSVGDWMDELTSEQTSQVIQVMYVSLVGPNVPASTENEAEPEKKR